MKLIADIDGARQEYPLKAGRNVIGRDLSCEITLLSPCISRRHVECTVEGQHAHLRDLGSKNGTFLGEQRVHEADLRPGDVVRLGRIVVRLALGTPPGTALPASAEAAVPEMQPEIAAPRLESYTQDPDPTPLDEQFAPSEPTEEPPVLTVEPEAPSQEGPEHRQLVPIQKEGPPAVGRTIESKPLTRRPLTPREKRLFLIPFTAGVAVLVVVVFSLVVLRPSKKEGILSHAAYNRHIVEAVELFERGERENCLKLLNQLRSRQVEGNPQTAAFMAAAVEKDLKLTDPQTFPQEWGQAKELWENLRTSSASTEEARNLATARITWIARESRNMAAFNDFQSSYDKGDWTEAMAAAKNIPADSIFFNLMEKRAGEAAAKFLETSLPRALDAEKRRDWDGALKIYDDIAAIPSLAPEAVEQGRARCFKHKTEAAHIQEASKQIADGNVAQATQLLADVDPKGPYASELADLLKMVSTTDLRARASAAYDAGQADVALKLLEDARLEQSQLYQRIRTVRDTWAKVEQALKGGKLQEAKAACQTIVDLEKSANNRYRIDASEFIASWQDKARQLSAQLRRDGIQAQGDGRFRQARDAFEEAMLVDPDGKIGKDEVENLKKEASRQYNHAINLAQTDAERALKLFRDIRDMLRPNDPYYDQTVEWVEKLSKKP